ncbi:MAG: HAMP domain-containing protein [Burkholderiales bacterium]|nr:HAMP domain-containing protein [Opitutaceae bacterium]
MRFRARVLLLLAGLVAASLGLMLAVVDYSSEREAIAQIRSRFARAAFSFRDLVARQNDQAAAFASLLAADHAFKRAFADTDAATLDSNLRSLLPRTDAHSIVVIGLEGETRAARDGAGPLSADGLFAPLIARAEADDSDRAEGCVWIGEELHKFILVPMRAPDVVAWVGLGRRVDDSLAKDLGERADVDVVVRRDNRARVLATTLPAAVADAFAASPASQDGLIVIGGERFLVDLVPLPHLAPAGASAYVLSSLDARLAPVRLVLARLLLAGLALFTVALVVALLFARSISHPVQQLAAHTRVIAGGDYATRLDLRRRDELGELADSFNALSAGLAERDLVRDLLDKNVSPEVAASLLREGAALGGEEREVTILFCDLRGFTPLSENLAPRDLVTLLNRYLDRMSAAIEAEGGIIDKYIGDEIMALFGAPVVTPDSADRAVRAALAMRDALAALNRELADEGSPPLAFGVGINTARVVAGNIGSHRRLNYSVIGDGVNLAARLQTLTRREEFASDIIVSEFTRAALVSDFSLRDLGEITVKGKSHAVRVHAAA